MNWFLLATAIVSKIPLERMFMKPRDNSEAVEKLVADLEASRASRPPIVSQPGRSFPKRAEALARLGDYQVIEAHDDGDMTVNVSGVLYVVTTEGEVFQETSLVSPDRPHVSPNNAMPSSTVSTPETVAYQKREIGKELLLLEKHLQQGCAIAGKPCDCCLKHPMAIEALSQETLGITGDHLYEEVSSWAKQIAPMTTEEAAASGQYNAHYPAMAVQARDLRKRIMGTDKVSALLTDAEKAKVKEQVVEALNQGE